MDGFSLLQDLAVVLVVAGFSGWIFRRLKLSAVVGYLVAGIIIGPYTPPFTLVTDVDRIETLTELGLAFLMFFVGLGLSLKRIRRLGPGVVVTTAVTAMLVFQLCQLFAGFLGWHGHSAFLFAAVFMTSSSAIITKMLAESKLTHERFAQNAQGVTVLEDVVAIILLTLLGSGLQGGGETRSVETTIYLLVTFAALLLVLGLIFLPRLLSRFGGAADSDLIAILMSGLVFLSGVASMRAGFSVALGAFLLGVVIAETRFKSQIEKSLGGAQDMFSAIFFVAIGMLINVQAFWENAWLILGISAFAIVARSLAATVGFVVSGNTLPLAVSSAVVVTPIGEFAYVIAKLGVEDGTMPESFFAVAVGVSIVTAILAPLLAKSAGRLGRVVEAVQPPVIARLLNGYHNALESGMAGMAKNNIWRMTNRRMGWMLVQALLLGGIFGFAQPLMQGFDRLAENAGWDFLGFRYALFGVLGVGALFLIVSLWLNCQTLSMIYADAFSMRLDKSGRLKIFLEFTFQMTSFLILAGSIWLAFPFREIAPILAGLLVLGPVLLSLFLWRQLSALHGRLESTLMARQTPQENRTRAKTIVDAGQDHDWKLEVTEITIPEFARCAGKSLKEIGLRPRFACSILEINRQGYVIEKVGPEERLYPGDRILLFGAEDQLRLGGEYLRRETQPEDESADFEESFLDHVEIFEGSPLQGKTVADSGILDKTGVQIMGIERQGQRILNPQGNETLQPGDSLLVLGSTSELRELRSLAGN